MWTILNTFFNDELKEVVKCITNNLTEYNNVIQKLENTEDD